MRIPDLENDDPGCDARRSVQQGAFPDVEGDYEDPEARDPYCEGPGAPGYPEPEVMDEPFDPGPMDEDDDANE